MENYCHMGSSVFNFWCYTNWVLWHMTVFPELGKQRKEDWLISSLAMYKVRDQLELWEIVLKNGCGFIFDPVFQVLCNHTSTPTSLYVSSHRFNLPICFPSAQCWINQHVFALAALIISSQYRDIWFQSLRLPLQINYGSKASLFALAVYLCLIRHYTVV